MKTYELKLTVIVKTNDDNRLIDSILSDMIMITYNDNDSIHYDNNDYLNGFKVDSVKEI